MKNLTLLVACAAMVAMVSCKGTGTKTGAAGAADSTAVTHVPSSAIAYVDLDSLVNHYDMYKDLKADYEAKAKKVDANITGQGNKLQSDIADFQNKVQKGLITSATAQSMQADLEKRQQYFMQAREKAMNDIGEEQQVMLNNIHFSITEYLKVFNSDMRYGMILSTSSGTPILNADPALDITSLVVEGLNKKYAADKASKKPEKADEKTDAPAAAKK